MDKEGNLSDFKESIKKDESDATILRLVYGETVTIRVPLTHQDGKLSTGSRDRLL